MDALDVDDSYSIDVYDTSAKISGHVPTTEHCLVFKNEYSNFQYKIYIHIFILSLSLFLSVKDLNIFVFKSQNNKNIQDYVHICGNCDFYFVVYRELLLYF